MMPNFNDDDSITSLEEKLLSSRCLCIMDSVAIVASEVGYSELVVR